jgi:hypothetical protein
MKVADVSRGLDGLNDLMLEQQLEKNFLKHRWISSSGKPKIPQKKTGRAAPGNGDIYLYPSNKEPETENDSFF